VDTSRFERIEKKKKSTKKMRILSFFPEGQIPKRPMVVFTKLLTMNIKAGVRKVQKLT
jgi:hypothetical protein